MEKDPYKILKLERGASSLEVERAYHKSMLNYGFDPRVFYSVEEREKIGSTVSEIEGAYQALANPDFKKKYFPAKITAPRQESPETGEKASQDTDSPERDTLSGELKGDLKKNKGVTLSLTAKGTYNEYFGFKESPFNLTPDTKFFYLSSKHKEALAHLFFGIQEQKGFVVITGEVGTGKTILCRSFLTQLDDSIKIAYIFNPCLSDLEILQSINSEFGLPSKNTSKKELISDFNRFLFEAKRQEKKVVIVIDEAQDLENKTLEQLRLLSNLETETEKLLQIVLVGQPELLDSLGKHEMRQLGQRITVRWNLASLDFNETQTYIHHRLKVARGWGNVSFSKGAIRNIFKASGGIPRMINVFSDRALLVAFTLGRKSINRRVALLAISNYRQDTEPRAKPFPRGTGMAITLILALFFTLYMGPWGGGFIKSLNMDPLIFKVSKTLELVYGTISNSIMKTEPPKKIVAVKNEEKKKEITPPIIAEEKVESPVPLPSPKAPVEEETVEVAKGPLENLKSLTPEQNQLRAYNMHLELWKAPPISEIDLKNFLRDAIHERGLHIFSFDGDFNKVRKLDFPIILELIFPDGTGKRLLPLSGLSDDYVFSGLENEIKIPIAHVQELWSGKGSVLWRDFESLNHNLKQPEKGPQVLWLQEGLERLGFFKATKTSYFGNLTTQSVMAFQKSHDIVQDGVVGPGTKMKLYKLLEYAIPSISVE